MSLYKEGDLQYFNDNIPKIMEKINNIVLEKYEPTRKEMTEVQKIILEFAKSKKRKLYGGYALHLAITDKNISASYYKKEDLYSKDIDIYSPEPIKDLVELCNILHEKGFKNVYGREALHTETYSLEVNKRAYVDFSYVPKNVYNHIPFLEIDGFCVTDPMFMSVDYLRMFSDPIMSAYRWEKSFERIFLLEKYYPVRHSTTPLNLNKKMDQKVFDKLNSFCKNNPTIASVGFQIYNYYLQESKIDVKYIKPIDIPYFEFVSTDYANDVKKIVELLKTVGNEKVSITEYYPFFMFTNNRTEILYGDHVVAVVYNILRNLCFSYLKYDNTNIASYLFNLRHCIICAMYARVNGDKTNEKMFYNIASHLIQMRTYYLDKNDKSFLYDSIFKDFIINCFGVTKNEKILKQEEFKSDKHKKFPFKYDPEDNKSIDFESWQFSNISGNKINNQKNFKIDIPEIHNYEQQDNTQK